MIAPRKKIPHPVSDSISPRRYALQRLGKIALFALLVFPNLSSGQAPVNLTDFFYQAIQMGPGDTMAFTAPREVILDDYVQLVISPGTIIAKYPEARRYLVQDSIFRIRGRINFWGKIFDRALVDTRITIRNFHFDQPVNFNLELYSLDPNEIFGYARLRFYHIRAPHLQMINNNFPTYVRNCVLGRVNIFSGTFAAPTLHFDYNEIDWLSLQGIELDLIRLENNDIKFSEFWEVEAAEVDIVHNRFQTPISGDSSIRASGRYWNFMSRSIDPEEKIVHVNDSSTYFRENVLQNPLLVIHSNDHAINNLIIRENYFFTNEQNPIVFLRQKSDFMYVRNNVFETPLILSSIVSSEFVFQNNDISKICFGIALPETPQHAVKIEWRDFSKKLYWQEDPFSPEYWGENTYELDDHTGFNNLMGTYGKMLQVFQDYRNIDDYNACLLEMKNLQLRRLKHTYHRDGGATNFFRYKLNQLLKVYTRHGTNPAQAITASVWIILFFSLIYFFFPSDWDKSSKSRLIRNFRDFVEKNDKGYFKPFLVMLGGLVASLFNAITLSVNSFVTLGFGAIPTKGLAKYICIFQGFLGWFLLSIFIVALINQVMF